MGQMLPMHQGRVAENRRPGREGPRDIGISYWGKYLFHVRRGGGAGMRLAVPGRGGQSKTGAAATVGRLPSIWGRASYVSGFSQGREAKGAKFGKVAQQTSRAPPA